MSKTSKLPAGRSDASLPASWMGFSSLRDEIDRMFAALEPMNMLQRGFSDGEPVGRVMQPFPAIDVTEAEDGYQVSAELPGVALEDIDIKLANGTLTIQGEKTEQKDDAGKGYHLSERRWGKFQRLLRVPDNVDEGRIEARYANGILLVTLPKSETALAAERTIEVSAG